MRRILLLVWLSMATFMGAQAQEIVASGSGENTSWELNDNGVLTINGSGEMDEEQAYEWVEYRDYVKKVIINEGITTICYGAFENMSNLSSVSLPQSLEVGEEAAFSGCTSLPIIDNARYADTYLVEVIDKSVTSFRFKEGTKYIGAHSFLGCSSLTEISIPESVEAICAAAFVGCTSLSSVSLHKNIEHIEESAFNRAEVHVVIPGNFYPIYVDYENPRLKTVISYAEYAPTMYECDWEIDDEEIFHPYTYVHAPLYVPEGAYWNYAYCRGWGEFCHIKEMAMDESTLQSRQAYMIADARGCNYTVYDADKDKLVNVEYTHSLDEESEGSCWTVLKEGGKSYLYNIGAKKFASMDNDGKLALSDSPVNMDITTTENGLSINGNACMFVLNKNIEIDATGIEDIIGNTDSAKKSEVYAIDGRRMDKAVRGINIVNGNKVLVK